MGDYGPDPIPVKHRLMRLIKMPGRDYRGHKKGCWILNTSCNGGGYPRIWDGKKSRVAHRVSYEIFIGKIPKGSYVLHRCDNKRCVNPKHLFIGTQSDNMKDSSAKGRISRGASHPPSKLNREHIRMIRHLRQTGFSFANLGMYYGVNKETIRDIIRGKTWRWVK